MWSQDSFQIEWRQEEELEENFSTNLKNTVRKRKMKISFSCWRWMRMCVLLETKEKREKGLHYVT